MRTNTDRQGQVEDLLRLGKSNREIGAKLYMADRTVKHHLTNIMTKLDVDNRTKAALKLNGVNIG